MSTERAPPSLRRRLMWSLLAAVALAALLQGFSAYRTALAQADEIFDYHMQQMAMSLGGGLGGGIHQGPEDVELVVQAWTAEGLQVFQSASRAGLPQTAVLGFADVQADGRLYRVLSVQRGGQVVQVAQELSVRQRLAQRLALRTVTPIAVVLPLLMGVVGWVVSRSLAPVERVRRQLAEREAEDLSPVAEEQLPAEVLPMVHELNSLLARVRQAFAAQQNFVADAAHELRSPLTALKLQVQALQRASDAPGRELSEARLASGIDRATRLVEQLLLLARQQAAAEPAQDLALEPLARQVLAEAAPLAQARGIDLGLPQAEAVRVRGQADALAVLLRNLVDNAIKYTPAGGRVDVRLIDEGERLRLRVEDSGPGIAPQERERVLDRFYRSSEGGGSGNAPGSGLGLAIVKSIADRHDARLLLDRSASLGGLQVDLLLAKA